MKMHSEVAFDPVLLDLADDRDLFVLTSALCDFALQADPTRRQVEDHAIASGSPLPDDPQLVRELSDRALALLGEIERQIDRNGAIRRGAVER